MSMRTLFFGPRGTARTRALRAIAGGSAAVLLVGSVTAVFDAPRAGAQSAPEDPALLRELVDRLSGVGLGVKAKIVVGSLPATTPPLAIPAGWRVIGGVMRAYPTGPGATAPSVDSSTAFVDAPSGSASDAISALTKGLLAGGWTSQTNGIPSQNGFVVANSPQPAYAQFCAKDANLSVNAMKDGGSPAIRVSLNASSNPPGYPSPCGGNGGPPVTEVPQIPVVYSQLPRLVLPETAVLVSMGGGGGSPFSSSSSLIVDKADAAPALEAFFAPQMTQAGWEKSGGASNDSVSVSTWRKKSDDMPLQATLVIVNAIGSATRRDLTITVSQEATEGNGFPGAPPYPVTIAPPVLTIPPPPNVAPAKAPSVAKAKQPKKAATKATSATKKK
jgi:hypothetical protein